MQSENDFQNLKDELRSLHSRLNFVRSELQEKIDGAKNDARAQASEDARRREALLNRVLSLESKATDRSPDINDGSLSLLKALYAAREVTSRVHSSARAIIVGGRYEVWCARCSKLLGHGDTARKAWEVASHAGPDSCVIEEHALLKVLNVHPGAAVSQFTPSSESGIFGSWWTVKCSTCGCALGSGASEQAAWQEASASENQFPCRAKPPLVDADFTLEMAEVDGKIGSHLELKELLKAGNVPVYPRTVVISSASETHTTSVNTPGKFHVTITEVPE